MPDIQSAIDHIKTAVDVDSWAADMAEKALEKRIPKPVKQQMGVGSHLMGKCPNCYHILMQEDHPAYCGMCGQKVIWNDAE